MSTRLIILLMLCSLYVSAQSIEASADSHVNNPGLSVNAPVNVSPVEGIDFCYLPIQSTISAPAIVCNGGDTIALYIPVFVAGLTYSWESASSASGPWSFLGFGGNNGYISKVLTATTYFRCTMFCPSNPTLTFTTPIDSVIVKTDTIPQFTVSNVAPICDGDTALLIMTSGLSYHLPTSQYNMAINPSGDSILIFPTTQFSQTTLFNYTVVGTDANGCTNEVLRIVTVHKRPNFSLVAYPNDSICENQELILKTVFSPTASNINLVWSSGATTPNDTLLLQQSANHSVVATNQLGCSVTKNLDIYVTALPILTISKPQNILCAGDSILLTATGADDYLWFPTPYKVSLANDSVWTVAYDSINYIIIGTTLFGCTSTVIENLKVTSLPAFSIAAFPNDTICIGNSLHLSAVSTDTITGFNFLWSTGNTTSVDTIESPLQNGIYALKVTNALGCSITDSVAIEVIDSLHGGFSVLSSGMSVLLVNEAQYATNYFYDFGNGVTSNIADPFITYTTFGNYTITQIVSNYCDSIITTKVLPIWPLGLEQATAKNFSIYPNPSSAKYFCIKVNDSMFFEPIVIATLDGKIVLSDIIRDTDTIINAEQFPSGLYIVQVGNQRLKWIKE